MYFLNIKGVVSQRFKYSHSCNLMKNLLIAPKIEFALGNTELTFQFNDSIQSSNARELHSFWAFQWHQKTNFSLLKIEETPLSMKSYLFTILTFDFCAMSGRNQTFCTSSDRWFAPKMLTMENFSHCGFLIDRTVKDEIFQQWWTESYQE